MAGRLLSRREAALWLGAFALASALLVLIRFTSSDPDSALYATLSERLAAGPVSRWIAPEWWGQWNMDGLFREHPAGVFLIPTALGALGIPAAQAAYIVGMAAGLGSLLLTAMLVSRILSPVEGRLALVLLQLMPMASIFRIRANHEYPMLFCLLLMLVGLDGVRRSWWWLAAVAVGLSFALLVKGAFVVMLFIAAALWIATNPVRVDASRTRPVLAILASLAVMLAMAVAYDALYLRATGETFWRPYWLRQLEPVTVSTPGEDGSTFVSHLLFYVLRMLWHPAPWSLAALVAAWRYRSRLADWLRHQPDGGQRGAVFVVLFMSSAVLLLSPASRFAERYAFSPNFLFGALGAIVACQIWPAVRARVQALDAAIPALPVVMWLGLVLLRLALGPFVPRININ